MDQRMLKQHVLDEVLEAAELFLPDEESDGSDPDEVELRKSYSGRGYGPEGFGLVIEGQRRIHRFFTALGRISAQYDEDQSMADDFDSDRAVQLADAAETDAMGRTGTILYFPGWSLED